MWRGTFPRGDCTRGMPGGGHTRSTRGSLVSAMERREKARRARERGLPRARMCFSVLSPRDFLLYAGAHECSKYARPTLCANWPTTYISTPFVCPSPYWDERAFIAPGLCANCSPRAEGSILPTGGEILLRSLRSGPTAEGRWAASDHSRRTDARLLATWKAWCNPWNPAWKVPGRALKRPGKG
jgi:hypothetical protein